MLPTPFSMLPDEARRLIKLEADQSVFHLGDEPSGFYFLKSGEVHLIRNGRDGEAIVIHRAFSGECFAEASLFSDTYHCDAVAVIASDIIHLNKAVALEYLTKHADFAFAFNAYLARQVQAYRRLLELRSIRSARARVCTAVQEGLLKGQINSFAAQIGLTHEATYRALSALVQSGELHKLGRGHFSLKETSK